MRRYQELGFEIEGYSVDVWPLHRGDAQFGLDRGDMKLHLGVAKTPKGLFGRVWLAWATDESRRRGEVDGCGTC